MNHFHSYNPCTGRVSAIYPVATEQEAASAVANAAVQQEKWSLLPVHQRCARLLQLRRLIAQEADTLADTVCSEIGKPRQEAYGAEILPCLRALQWLGRHAPRLLAPCPVPGAKNAWQQAAPLGVVGVIGTWNYPLLLDLTPMAWALAAGNAVVWKPSELATGSALALYHLVQQADLPVQLITGDASAGAALCDSLIQGLAFTGSAAAGRAILGRLAARGIPSVMELSGNDAAIVCHDANAADAARSAVWARCCNAGQSCVAPQRFFVHKHIADAFLSECALHMRALRPGRDYGPMRTHEMRERANMLVQNALDKGANLLCGGEKQPGEGYYYTPALLTRCTPDMPVMKEDFFGPVLCVCVVESEEQAVAMANRCAFALGASVWTRNRERGRSLAMQLQAGMVGINRETLLMAADPSLPFGGMKASGFGTLRGAAGLEPWVRRKVISAQKPGGIKRHLFPYKTAALPILESIVELQINRYDTGMLRCLTQALIGWRRPEEVMEEQPASQPFYDAAADAHLHAQEGENLYDV